jgi:hypothetical protein
MPQSDFNPDAYLAEKTGAKDSSFDPDKYLSEKSGGLPEDKFTPTQSAAIGAQSGLALGLRPFAGGVGGALGAAYGKFEGNRNQGKGLIESLSGTGEAAKKGFSEARGEVNEEQGEAAKENPKAYYGANIAGSIPGGILTPIKTLGGAAKVGAGYGAANALSTANNATDAAKDVAGGAATGALFHGILSKVFPAASSAANSEASDIIDQATNGSLQHEADMNLPVVQGPPGSPGFMKGSEYQPEKLGFLQKQAGLRASKAMGPMLKDAKKAGDLDTLAQQGNVLLKEGVVGGMPTSYEGLADRADKALTNKGQEFEDAINQIAAGSKARAEQMGPGANHGLDKKSMIQSIQQELSPVPGIPALKSRLGQQQELLGQVAQGPQFMSILDAQKLKTAIGKQLESRNVWNSLKQGKELNTENEFLVSYYHALNKGVEDAADASASTMGPQVLSNWQRIKQEYGTLKTASTIANTAAKREFANRFISPSDYIAGAVGAAAVGPHGVPLAIVNHFGRKYGNQILATGLNQAAQLAKTQPARAIGGMIGAAQNAGSRFVPQATSVLTNTAVNR